MLDQRLACLFILCGAFVHAACSSDTSVLLDRESHEVVPAWPALAEGVTLGQVSGVALDQDENVWTFSRRSQPWFGDEVTTTIPEDTVFQLAPDDGAVLSQTGHDAYEIPHGLYIDTEGNLWVTDVSLHIVQKLSPNGEVLLTLGVAGYPGDDASHFNQPTDVYVATNGRVFVSDGYGNARVVVFDADGTYLFEWGSAGSDPGQFDTPHSIVGDGNDRIYVADRGNRRVQVFNEMGTHMATWQSPELGRPWAVNIAPNGDIYVLDGGDQNPVPPDRARVLRVDQDGNVLDEFGSGGREAGQFDWPHDLAISSSGDVYVGEVHYGARLQKFAPTS